MLKYPPYSLFAGTELPLKWTHPVSQEQSWDALNSLKGGCSTAAMCLRTVCSPYAQPSLMVLLLQSYINQSPSHSQCGTGQGNSFCSLSPDKTRLRTVETHRNPCANDFSLLSQNLGGPVPERCQALEGSHCVRLLLGAPDYIGEYVCKKMSLAGWC